MLCEIRLRGLNLYLQHELVGPGRSQEVAKYRISSSVVLSMCFSLRTLGFCFLFIIH